LNGNKTQTRRVLKGAWQNALEGHDRVKTWFAPPNVPKEGIPNLWAQSGIWAEKHGPRGYNRFLGFAAYRPGDILWVREAWRTGGVFDPVLPRNIPRTAHIAFEADAGRAHLTGKLRPGMFMPRWASRITLEVTGVKIERLQGISEADAIAEGIARHTGPDTPYTWVGRHNTGQSFDPRCAYAGLWDDIRHDQPEHGWDANPWVAAYTFRVIWAGEQADG
jgi:hypothetical protein